MSACGISTSTITFPGTYDSLSEIAEFVRQAATQAGLDSAAIYAVETAVDEACTNIIEHAYEAEGVGDIQCTCKVDSDSLTIILKDHGKPFDPDNIPEPDLSLPLEEREPHGLGLFFIRKFMDEVHFQFTSDQENTLTMIKRKEKKI